MDVRLSGQLPLECGLIEHHSKSLFEELVAGQRHAFTLMNLPEHIDFAARIRSNRETFHVHYTTTVWTFDRIGGAQSAMMAVIGDELLLLAKDLLMNLLALAGTHDVVHIMLDPRVFDRQDLLFLLSPCNLRQLNVVFRASQWLPETH